MKTFATFFVFSLLNYLVGSVPFALLIGELFYHTDVRTAGSHNLGATNAGRVLGKKAAFAVAIGDALKGVVLYLVEQQLNPAVALWTAFFTLVGHCYPVYAHFKGGKAVATTTGIMFAFGLCGLKEFLFIFLIPGILWLIVFYSSRLVSLASLSMVCLAPLLTALIIKDYAKAGALLLMALFVIYRHRENIKRLINHAEPKTYLSHPPKHDA